MYKGVDSTFDCVHTQVRDIVLCAGKYYAKHKKATQCCVRRHTQGREECCVRRECCVHTQGTHIGGKSVECRGNVAHVHT